MTAFLYPGALSLSPRPIKIRPFRCTTRAFTTQAAWLWRPVSLISPWLSAILRALCVVLFGIHHRRRKDHREKMVKLRYNLYGDGFARAENSDCVRSPWRAQVVL